jgi:hypothetical protein
VASAAADAAVADGRGAAKAEKNLREAFDAADVGRQASLA